MLKRQLLKGLLENTSLKLLGPGRSGSVLRMASSCCVSLGNPLDLSGLQAPPVQVRGVDQVISRLLWPMVFSLDRPPALTAPLCPEAGLRAPEKVLFPVLQPRAEASSPPPSLSPHLEASALER